MDNSVREQRQKKSPGILSNKMLIRRTLNEMSEYTHRVDNMAEGSAGMTLASTAGHEPAREITMGFESINQPPVDANETC